MFHLQSLLGTTCFCSRSANALKQKPGRDHSINTEVQCLGHGLSLVVAMFSFLLKHELVFLTILL